MDNKTVETGAVEKQVEDMGKAVKGFFKHLDGFMTRLAERIVDEWKKVEKQN